MPTEEPFMRKSLVFTAVLALLSAMSYLGATSSSAGEGLSPGSAVQVKIEGYSFKPATIGVPVGTTITWKNLDDDPHTVTANDGSFNSKGLAQGDSWSRKFDKPGRYTYHCAIHPVMQGVVIVRSQSNGS
jgi:plastocyanin